jgi:GDPmannose 4,6-dehydratase
MRAVVLGVNGQDGSYMAEHLLQAGHDVTGIGRQDSSRYVGPCPRFEYRCLDIADAGALSRLLEETQPDEIHHLAAIHGPNAPSYEPVWRQMMAVNTLSLHAVLEYARSRDGAVRVTYANSTKIFGRLPPRVDESAPRQGKDLYSITKNAAFDLIGHYRASFGVKVIDMILSNHDSPRRPTGFFLTDLTQCLARAIEDPTATRTFRTLDFWIDSGDASEFMHIASQLSAKGIEGDILFATGQTWRGRDLVEKLFHCHGLDYRRHVLTEMPEGVAGPKFSFDTTQLIAANDGHPVKRDILDVAIEMLAKLEETAR